MFSPKKYPLIEMAQKEQQNRTALITAAKIDNLLRDLQTDITPASQIEFIDMTQEDGRLAYQRSVLFIMMASVNLLYPDKEVVVEHSVNNGVYCELLPKGDLTAEDVVRIEAKMREFIEKKKDIFKGSLPREDAVALFRESQQIEKSKLIESLKQDIVSLYYCSGYYDYLYGPMLYNTELLDKFGFTPCFSFISGAESDAHAGKAEIVRRAMEALSARAEDTVMVGDRHHDVDAAAEYLIADDGKGVGEQSDALGMLHDVLFPHRTHQLPAPDVFHPI